MPRTSDRSVSVNGRLIRLTDKTQPTSLSEYRLCDAQSGGEVRAETARGVLSADVLSAAAFVWAADSGYSGKAVVMLEASACPSLVPAVVESETGKVTLVLPVPSLKRHADGDLSVRFPGITCVVSQGESAQHFTDAPCIVVLRDDAGENVRAILKEKENEPCAELSASALAATAAAIDLAQSISDGVIEYNVGMSGQTIEVGVSKRGGSVAGVSVCSTVRI